MVSTISSANSSYFGPFRGDAKNFHKDIRSVTASDKTTKKGSVSDGNKTGDKSVLLHLRKLLIEIFVKHRKEYRLDYKRIVSDAKVR